MSAGAAATIARVRGSAGWLARPLVFPIRATIFDLDAILGGADHVGATRVPWTRHCW